MLHEHLYSADVGIPPGTPAAKYQSYVAGRAAEKEFLNYIVKSYYCLMLYTGKGTIFL